jgi:hypothetical protein
MREKAMPKSFVAAAHHDLATILTAILPYQLVLIETGDALMSAGYGQIHLLSSIQAGLTGPSHWTRKV